MISKAEHQQIEDTPAVSQQQLRPVDSRLVNIDRLAQEIARAMGFTKAEFALKAVSLTNAIVERCNKGEFQLYCEDWPYPFALGELEAVHGGLRLMDGDADKLRSFYLGQAGGLTDSPEPERRLARLRSLGGSATYKRGEWKFRGITALVKVEKSEERNRSDEKTIRDDLREAAQNELDAKRAGVFDGLGQR